MSAVRLCVARLTPLVALAALSLIAGCTKPTPLYCEKPEDCGADHGYVAGYYCDMSIRTCKLGNTPVDANDSGTTGDAPADGPTDGGTGEDRLSTDGPRGDASDGSVDVFHGCADNRGCPDSTKHVCQVDAGVCVGCLQNGDCTTAGARACDTTANKCVECVVNGDCADPTKPVCDHQACRACNADSECAGTGPGVCMFHLDGHCATDSETVYVAPLASNGCSDTGADGGVPGTAALPFCMSQDAIDATSFPAPSPSRDGGAGADGGSTDAATGIDGGTAPASHRALVVMRGGSLSDWSFNIAGRTLTVVGQSNAVISPGARIGIHVSAGTVYVRNVRVTGGGMSQPAVVADGGELHLDRCVVDNNGKGGVQVDNAGYEITNSVLANNSAGTFTGPISWGGALLGAVPAGKPATFLNNTIVNNGATGVVCTQGNVHNISGSILYGNNLGSALVCNVSPCCDGVGPAFGNVPYHLSATSPCRDQLRINMSTSYDIDGDPRPSGTLSDCGADEYTGQ